MIYNAKSDISGTINPFNYRKKITISHSGALTAYQVKLIVDHVNTNMRTDFGDIRFNTDTGNYIPYWIENVNGTLADVWVKADLLNGDTIIYMYYGNTNLTSISDGNNVFDFFDDFNGSLSKWGTTNGTPTINGGNLELNAADKVKSTATFAVDTHRLMIRTDGYKFSTWMYWFGYANNAWTGSWYTPNDTVGTWYECSGSGGHRGFIDNNPPATTTPWIGSEWATLEIRGSNDAKSVWYRKNGGSEWSYTSTSFGSNPASINIGVADLSGAGTLLIDWVAIRKYTTTEPTYTTSTEQTITAKSMSIIPRETPCRVGICVVDVNVTWTNNGESATFTPSIIIDSNTISLAPRSLPNGDTLITFPVSGLSAGNHTICPDPN